jgi:tetratricopeptide (TPR) repeat protein
MARAWLIGGLFFLCAPRALAADDRVELAKQLYLDGKNEFENQRYESALRSFERAYELSARPALLFDMATCLSALDRPREAAAKLRDYLDRVPRERQRAAIEDSIGELKARAIDQEAAVTAEREARRDDPKRLALEERMRLLEQRLDTPAPPRRRNLAIGLGVAAGVLVAVGVGLGIGLGLRHPEDSYTPSSYGGGPLQSTR